MKKNIENAVETAKDIKRIFGRWGVENASLNKFIKEAETLPDSKVIDQYNELVDRYRSARKIDDVISISQELIALINSHPQDLASKKVHVPKLEQYVQDTLAIKQLYNRLESQISEL